MTKGSIFVKILVLSFLGELLTSVRISNMDTTGQIIGRFRLRLCLEIGANLTKTSDRVN